MSPSLTGCLCFDYSSGETVDECSEATNVAVVADIGEEQHQQQQQQHSQKNLVGRSASQNVTLNGNGAGSVSRVTSRSHMEQEKRMRREIANSNERRRMQSINAGFQSLRTLLPHHEGEKLSKVSRGNLPRNTHSRMFLLSGSISFWMRTRQRHTTLVTCFNTCLVRSLEEWSSDSSWHLLRSTFAPRHHCTLFVISLGAFTRYFRLAYHWHVMKRWYAYNVLK